LDTPGASRVEEPNVLFQELEESRNWKKVGAKEELAMIVYAITGIDEEYLRGANIQLASIAKRMSWAAGIRASKPEDIAYCPLGIFDVNMPLTFGEEQRAFNASKNVSWPNQMTKAFPHGVRRIHMYSRSWSHLFAFSLGLLMTSCI
jgi:hypothetical protein